MTRFPLLENLFRDHQQAYERILPEAVDYKAEKQMQRLAIITKPDAIKVASESRTGDFCIETLPTSSCWNRPATVWLVHPNDRRPHDK